MESKSNDFPKLGIKTQELIDAIEADIAKAQRLRSKQEWGAVNWGGLGVRDVEYRLSMLHPQEGPICVVMIEEASPDCALALWLYDRLDKTKFPQTYIECEW